MYGVLLKKLRISSISNAHYMLRERKWLRKVGKKNEEKKLSYIVVERNRKMNETNVHFIPFLMRFYPR